MAWKRPSFTGSVFVFFFPVRMRPLSTSLAPNASRRPSFSASVAKPAWLQMRPAALQKSVPASVATCQALQIQHLFQRYFPAFVAACPALQTSFLRTSETMAWLQMPPGALHESFPASVASISSFCGQRFRHLV